MIVIDNIWYDCMQVAVHFHDDVEGKSREVRIGWVDTLQFSNIIQFKTSLEAIRQRMIFVETQPR